MCWRLEHDGKQYMFHVKRNDVWSYSESTVQSFLKSVFLRRCLTVTGNQCNCRSWLVKCFYIWNWLHKANGQSSELGKAQATVEWRWVIESRIKVPCIVCCSSVPELETSNILRFYPVLVEAASPFVGAHAACWGRSSINLHASSMHNHSPNTAAVVSNRSPSVLCYDALSPCCLANTL